MAKQALHSGAKVSAGAEQSQIEETVLKASGRSVNDAFSERVHKCALPSGFSIAGVILRACVWRSVPASCQAQRLTAIDHRTFVFFLICIACDIENNLLAFGTKSNSDNNNG